MKYSKKKSCRLCDSSYTYKNSAGLCYDCIKTLPKDLVLKYSREKYEVVFTIVVIASIVFLIASLS